MESFVLREGTDYGEREHSLEQKVAQVRAQLERGQARILFDPQSNTITIEVVPQLGKVRGLLDSSSHPSLYGGVKAMNDDRAAGQWKQLKGNIKEQWGKLTDDEITQLEGHRDQLAGKLQERYGLAREEAERQAKEFSTRHNWH